MKAFRIASGIDLITAAKMTEADETGETIDRTFKMITEHKLKQ
jgi:hypothetical protein